MSKLLDRDWFSGTVTWGRLIEKEAAVRATMLPGWFQDLLLDPLATKLLIGEFKPGDRVKVVAHNGELEFEKK